MNHRGTETQSKYSINGAGKLLALSRRDMRQEPNVSTTLKRWAIIKHPSGMKNEILVALDFQSAGLANFAALADWKSAIQQTGSLRYGAASGKMRVRCRLCRLCRRTIARGLRHGTMRAQGR